MPDLLGLEAPERPKNLTYSASATDGAVETSSDGAPVGAQGGNREQRRAAAKAAKKRR